jgi:hypothetical protein
MIDRLYIISGTNEQYLNFVKRKVSESWNVGDTDISMSNFVYVRSPDQLRGIRDPRGYFIGTWYENPNIVQILNQLVVSMSDLDRVSNLNKMYIIYNEHQFNKVMGNV